MKNSKIQNNYWTIAWIICGVSITILIGLNAYKSGYEAGIEAYADQRTKELDACIEANIKRTSIQVLKLLSLVEVEKKCTVKILQRIIEKEKPQYPIPYRYPVNKYSNN